MPPLYYYAKKSYAPSALRIMSGQPMYYETIIKVDIMCDADGILVGRRMQNGQKII